MSETVWQTDGIKNKYVMVSSEIRRLITLLEDANQYGMASIAPLLVEAGALPQPFVGALTRLAKAFVGVHAVIVGGAAVTFYTSGSILSGDFDFVVHGDHAALSKAMNAEGFINEDRPGRLKVGWYHPDLPHYGFQSVSGQLFDGRSDPSKLRTCSFGGNKIVFASPEDLIADRMGQHTVASPTDYSRLAQARMIYRMVTNLDKSYMARRIKEDGGDISLLIGDGK